MKNRAFLLAFSCVLSGCTTNGQSAKIDLTSKSTNALCHVVLANPDQATKQQAVDLLVRRGATVEKCQRLITSDNQIMTGIAVAGVAVAAGAAAKNGYGGYYAPHSYGAAWDAFYNYGRVAWRCRDRATGRFVPDYMCAGSPMNDYTWPGPYI